MGIVRAGGWPASPFLAKLGHLVGESVDREFKLKMTAIGAIVFVSLLSAGCSPGEPPAPPAYVSSCMPCHGDGLGGAPVTGDRDEWARRIAKGTAKVHRNVIEGFEGGTGVMPAKGGRADLSDEEIIALVDYMLEASR
jgi:cytochrome c5